MSPASARSAALKRTTEVVKHREGGDPSSSRKSPGRTEYEAITLERGVTHDTEFEKWANKIWNFGAGLGAEVSLKDFRKDLIIEVYNEAGQLAITYKVYRCWVSEFQALPDLDANANAVAIQHIKLENEGWERDASVPEPAEPTLSTVPPHDRHAPPSTPSCWRMGGRAVPEPVDRALAVAVRRAGRDARFPRELAHWRARFAAACPARRDFRPPPLPLAQLVRNAARRSSSASMQHRALHRADGRRRQISARFRFKLATTISTCVRRTASTWPRFPLIPDAEDQARTCSLVAGRALHKRRPDRSRPPAAGSRCRSGRSPGTGRSPGGHSRGPGLPDLRLPLAGTVRYRSYLWHEVDAWALRLLRDVHRLARAYSWREADILALSPSRRQCYLDLLNE